MRILKTTLICATAAAALAAQAQKVSDFDYNAPIGWGVYDEATQVITGGSDNNPILVTTYDELTANIKGTASRTLYIQGEIEVPGKIGVSNARNLTIYGLPGSALVNPTHTAKVDSTGILSFSDSRNIIIRNVTFKSAGAYDIDGNDNLNLTTCKYVWVDHCDFQDGVDGNFDCNNGSDFICVSWCQFHYLISPWAGGSGGSNDHRFTNLWGGSDSNASKDQGKLNTTFYSCWWGDGCRERMPRIRFGKVHILNCLYSCTGNNYCVGTGYACNAYVENCVFKSGVSNPWKNYATSSGKTDYNITLTGCSGKSDEQKRSGDIDYFIPSEYYWYEAYDVDKVEEEVSTYAGAILDVTYGSGVNAEGAYAGIGKVGAEGSVAERVAYYSLSGVRLSGPQKGLNIVRRTMSDGAVNTFKTIVR